MSNFENDPESIMDAEREETQALRDEFHDTRYEDFVADQMDTDPFAEWFAPGYVTEMDYMNAQEADDYRNEMEDVEF